MTNFSSITNHHESSSPRFHAVPLVFHCKSTILFRHRQIIKSKNHMLLNMIFQPQSYPLYIPADYMIPGFQPH